MIPVTIERITRTFPRAGTVIDEVSLQVRAGELFTLLGPSGCGKSTLLRIVAGFEEPTGGRVLFGDRDVTHDPPNRRGIGFAFQNYALFPHLTVRENVAFGLQVRKVGRREVTGRVQKALADVKLEDCGSERVERLSGGQQQRVALARALVLDPPLLLLDEPLSNLDASLRQEARALIRHLHRRSGATVLYVTHDQAEAMAMSDRIGILRGGRLHQIGAPPDIYERPATRFVADFIGRNSVLDATLCDTCGSRPLVRFRDGSELAVDAGRLGPAMTFETGARLAVCLRPDSLRITDERATFRGMVAAVEYAGAVNVCEVETAAGTLRVDVPRARIAPARGDFVHIAVDAAAVHLVPTEPRP
jgi:iron(III) transport system ATP-binding protein